MSSKEKSQLLSSTPIEGLSSVKYFETYDGPHIRPFKLGWTLPQSSACRGGEDPPSDHNRHFSNKHSRSRYILHIVGISFRPCLL